MVDSKAGLEGLEIKFRKTFAGARFSTECAVSTQCSQLWDVSHKCTFKR